MLVSNCFRIAKLCEDRRKRDDFLSTVYNHRIVFSLQSCEQLLSPVPEHSLVGSENSHLLFQSGTLYLIVANRQFGEEQFQPDLSLLSMCEEQDSMPSLNLQLSSPYVSSRRLPLDVRRDIKNATPFLHSALDRLASVTGKDFLFECNFDDVFVATEASPTNRYIPGSTVYANYLLHACDRYASRVESAVCCLLILTKCVVLLITFRKTQQPEDQNSWRQFIGIKLFSRVGVYSPCRNLTL